MNILTFDVEDWFHILDNQSTKGAAEWNNYHSRIDINMNKIFDFLEQHNLKATFFCLGWISKKHPHIIKKINERGFEIGSHTTYHQLIFEQTPKEFKKDLDYSIKLISDLTGKEVRCFRAPGFSIKYENLWAFEIIAEQGITIDSSVFPAIRGHGGMPKFNKSKPFIIDYKRFKIKEFPMNTIKILNNDFVFTGGGYFRFFPYWFIKKHTANSKYIMTYFHPRDFDPRQPLIKDLGIYRKFKTYYGLNGSFKKLEKWISDFEFIDIDTANKLINWDKADIIKLDS